mmetsp:Transcript_10693/g.35569  ORF Transcript_10693/g.35569 Transcript_10693/m.35569 type:complete len:362 (+) Transcript_10693:42-1127(+)
MIKDSNPVCEGVAHAAPVVVGGALHLLERGVEAAILQVVHEERGRARRAVEASARRLVRAERVAPEVVDPAADVDVLDAEGGVGEPVASRCVLVFLPLQRLPAGPSRLRHPASHHGRGGDPCEQLCREDVPGAGGVREGRHGADVVARGDEALRVRHAPAPPKVAQRGVARPAEAAPVSAHAGPVRGRHVGCPVDCPDEGVREAGGVLKQGQQLRQVDRGVVVDLADEGHVGEVGRRVLEEGVLLEGGHSAPAGAEVGVARLLPKEHVRLCDGQEEHVSVPPRLRRQPRHLARRVQGGEQEADSHPVAHCAEPHPRPARGGAARPPPAARQGRHAEQQRGARVELAHAAVAPEGGRGSRRS